MAIIWMFLVLIVSAPGQAQETLRHLPVVAIEYPPFVSQELPGSGVSFVLLNRLLAPHGWYAEGDFLPPARAAQRVQEADSWVLSFFPAPSRPDVTVVKLGEADIRYSLFRRREKAPFRWQSLNELQGRSVVMHRQSADSADAHAFREAGMEVVFVNELEQAVQMVLSGRADYLLAAEETGFY